MKEHTSKIFWLAAAICHLVLVFAQFDDIRPKIRINYLAKRNADQIQTFSGNQTRKDHFKLLRSDGVSILVGARNVVYNLSLTDLKENVEQRITWHSKKSDRELCLIKGKSEDDCQNYIRILAPTDRSTLLVCGTNSFNPKCRTYTKTSAEMAPDAKHFSETWSGRKQKVMEEVDKEVAEVLASDSNEVEKKFKVRHEFSGIGFCPHDPKHNSTAIFTGGELYSGTASDFSGSDALIYRGLLRTEQYNLKILNAPNFVSSLEDEDHVYFFFREAAVEYINCGKTVYSRVARVCKNDRGGSPRHRFAQRWTTFLKARLNCSVPGDFPFYFDEIQATTSEMVTSSSSSSSSRMKDKIIYGVFTTPENSISGSAVCAFSLLDVFKSFEGSFKSQSGTNTNWLPVRRDESFHHLGHCQAGGDSRNLSENALNFIKDHSLMDRAVPNLFSTPIFIKTSLNERLTTIAVDSGVHQALDESSLYDVIYLGTTKGKVLKVVNDKSKKFPLLIEEIQVFNVPVKSLEVMSVGGDYKKLIVLSDQEVKALPLQRCHQVVTSCEECVALRDPHCAWDLNTAKCVEFNHFDKSKLLLQNVALGKHAGCPRSSNKIEEEEKVNEVDVDSVEHIISYSSHEVRRSSEERASYTGISLTTATLASFVIALIIGFTSGFLTSRKCSKDGYRNCGHHYLEQQTNLNKSQENSALHQTESGYTSAPCNNISSTTGSAVAATAATAVTSNTTRTTTISSDASEKNSKNLLINLQQKTEVEKNSIGNTVVPPPPAGESGVIFNGTMSRNNGTLCKKVYL